MTELLGWVSDCGVIDITKFNHLKFRKDGWFDCRRNRAYYKELKEHIRQKELELVGINCELLGKMPRLWWTKPSDKLPKQDETVLVCIGRDVGIGGYSSGFGWWMTGAEFEDAPVDFWMPLPEAPGCRDSQTVQANLDAVQARGYQLPPNDQWCVGCSPDDCPGGCSA